MNKYKNHAIKRFLAVVLSVAMIITYMPMSISCWHMMINAPEAVQEVNN